MSDSTLWQRYTDFLCSCPEISLSLDISRMKFSQDFFNRMEPAMQRAFASMTALEKGAIANPDEGRMVGHYWLRNSALAPTAELKKEIDETVSQISEFCCRVHTGQLVNPAGEKFRNFLVIGIGGSALGPQFVADAMASSQNAMRPYFLDNTDPDGMDRVFADLGHNISRTLAVIISKSGSTKETRNGMLETQAAYRSAGLDFAKHAVAVTGYESELYNLAKRESWIECFPMWDWVGGRTSVTSAVGLLPAGLQGIDITALLKGAESCDKITRVPITMKNPAALMALMWYCGSNGNGEKDMVMLPYKDRLLLFSRYLQQLIMESIGKELDLEGKPVYQGLTVYGNKGSTDQHAYVQQLREGVANFFVTFIEVLQDRAGVSMQVDPGITSGDYLFGFFQGTRTALYEMGRESMTITVETVDAHTIGALIALFERTVGLYASLVNINAYHQPGVEAGKKAAGVVITLQKMVVELLEKEKKGLTAEQIATQLGRLNDVETIFAILRHLAANPDRKIYCNGVCPAKDITFCMK